MRKTIVASILIGLFPGFVPAAGFPNSEISNAQLRVKIYLPDAKNGFYRGARFDWSGVVFSLQFQGHEFYGPWFDRIDPKVHDFVYEGAEIVAGLCSAITGPVDEFKPVGYDEAKAGGNFIKIGVGALRKPDDGKYDNYRVYDVVNPVKWTIRKGSDSIEFIQKVVDSSSGFGYIYKKKLRLTPGKPEMVLEHSLANAGTLMIDTSVYNHNFLVLDKQPPGPGFAITVPFQIESPRPPRKELAEIRGNQIVYLKTLENRDVVATPVRGFKETSGDHEIRIENSRLGAGMRITSDRPLCNESLWSIRSVIAMEPFVCISIQPGKQFTWKTTYSFYTLPATAK